MQASCNAKKISTQQTECVYICFPITYIRSENMLSERDVGNIQSAMINHMRDLRKHHQSWNAYKDSFATKLQEWDSYSLEDSLVLDHSGEKIFPTKQDSLISESSSKREEIMARGRKIDLACSELLLEEEQLVNAVFSMLGNR